MTRSKRIRLLTVGAITGFDALVLHKARLARNNSTNMLDLRDKFDVQQYSNRYNH